MISNPHKILRMFVQTRLNKLHVDSNISPLDALKKAEEDKVLNKFKNDIYFCMYKTDYEEEEAIIMFFTMMLPGPTTGSSASSEIIMDLVALLEKLLMPIDHMNLSRDIDGSRKNIATLTLIKKIRADDVL